MSYQVERNKLISDFCDYLNLRYGSDSFKEIPKVQTNDKAIPTKINGVTCELQNIIKDDLTSGKTIGRYDVEVTVFIVKNSFDYENDKDLILKAIQDLLENNNYNFNDNINFSEITDKQAEIKFTLDIGLNLCEQNEYLLTVNDFEFLTENDNYLEAI
jgi:hypothetical protein